MTLLHSKRLTLSSQLTENDLGAVVGWLNDPEVVRYSEQRHKKHSIDTQYKYLMGFDPRDFYLGIHRDWKLIGTITAIVDRPNEVANMGMMIGDRSLWGRGYGLEAWACLGRHLFQNDVRKIEAGCMASNSGMMKVCKRYGMVIEGTRKNYFKVDDQYIDLIQWGGFNEPSPKFFKRRGRSVAPAKRQHRSQSIYSGTTIGFVTDAPMGFGGGLRQREIPE